LTAAAYKLAYENAIGLLTDFICFPAENARNKNANTQIRMQKMKERVESEGEIAFGPQSFEVWRQLRWLDKQQQNKIQNIVRIKNKTIYIYILKCPVGAATSSLFFSLLTAATLAYKLFFSWQNF